MFHLHLMQEIYIQTWLFKLLFRLNGQDCAEFAALENQRI